MVTESVQKLPGDQSDLEQQCIFAQARIHSYVGTVVNRDGPRLREDYTRISNLNIKQAPVSL